MRPYPARLVVDRYPVQPAAIQVPILPELGGLGARGAFHDFGRRYVPAFDRIAPSRQDTESLCSVSEERQAKRFYVSGRVQGVGYRFFAHHAAEQLGITGYVRNMLDGRVEVYAIGTAAQLDVLLAELRRGPRHAHVEAVSEADAEWLPRFTSHFSIDHDG
jgi:acylphosphatase